MEPPVEVQGTSFLYFAEAVTMQGQLAAKMNYESLKLTFGFSDFRFQLSTINGFIRAEMEAGLQAAQKDSEAKQILSCSYS
jgi:hypothetical protein